LDKNFVDKQNEILKSITKADVDALAKKHLPYDKMIILVVGDKAKIYDGLSKLGYEIVELDMDGNPMKATTEKPKEETGKKEEAKTPVQNAPAPTDGTGRQKAKVVPLDGKTR
jgi:zinc protease